MEPMQDSDKMISLHVRTQHSCQPDDNLADENSIQFSFMRSPDTLPMISVRIDTHALDFFEPLKSNPETYCYNTTITPAMGMVLEQIVHCPYEGELKKLYLQAKGLELITLRIGHCSKEPQPGKTYPLNHTDIDRLHEAHTILTERYATPPSVQEIAALVGINTNKLKYGFRQIFGTTVYQCIRNLRLEQARCLLQTGKFSVTEVAFLVGYSSLSHFARLFKTAYGICPHAFSKQGKHFS